MTVAVFAEGDKAREAETAGADIVGGEDLAKRVQEGFDEFDVAIATPDMMGTVGKLGRILGPSGQDAEPQERHGHLRRRQGRHATSRAARSSTAPTAPASSTSASASGPSRSASCVENYQVVHRGDRPRQAGGGQGRVPEVDHHGPDDGPRASRSTPPASRRPTCWRSPPRRRRPAHDPTEDPRGRRRPPQTARSARAPRARSAQSSSGPRAARLPLAARTGDEHEGGEPLNRDEKDRGHRGAQPSASRRAARSSPPTSAA